MKKRVVIRRKRSELMMVEDQHTNYGEPHFGEGYLKKIVGYQVVYFTD